MMHLKRIEIRSGDFPRVGMYPFHLPVLNATDHLDFNTPVTFFVGENGSGKSTLLEAMAAACGIHVWRPEVTGKVNHNPYEMALHHFLTPHWENDRVPGSFFASEIFKTFALNLEEWARTNPGQLKYFGGRSLLDQSHGQSLLSFFRSRYQIRGLYLLDEPETALSPASLLELLRLLKEMGDQGHAQFIVATHSPILMACPGAVIYNFDEHPARTVTYEQTEHFKVYRDFLTDPAKFFS